MLCLLRDSLPSRRPERRSKTGAPIIPKPPAPLEPVSENEVALVGLDGEFPLAGASPVDPAARWATSRSSPPRVEENALVVATAMAVDLPEGASREAAAVAGASAAPADVSPAEGDARERPILVGEERAEVTPPAA